MLMHASIDNTARIVTSPAPAAVSNPFELPNAPLPWITAAILCASAIWFLVQMRNRRRKWPRLSLPLFL
jgi:hypothetical protein